MQFEWISLSWPLCLFGQNKDGTHPTKRLPSSGGVEAVAPHRAARRAGPPHAGAHCAAAAAGARRRGGGTPGQTHGDGRRHGEVPWGEALEGHRPGPVISLFGRMSHEMY